MKSRLPTLALTVLCLIGTMQAAPVPPNPGASVGPAGWERGFEGQRKADIGNGSYLNPILSGDRPDPSVLKFGKDYYLVNSSFESVPGLLIWHSQDLVNWEPVGPALTRYVGSVWAPDLAYHNGRFYIYFPALTANRLTNMVVTAESIRGPWSDPVDLNRMKTTKSRKTKP